MPVSATASAIADVEHLRGVVLHVEPLPHQIGGEVLEAGQVLEAPLEDRDLFAAVHAFDLEGRFGVQLADGAGAVMRLGGIAAASGAASRATAARYAGCGALPCRSRVALPRAPVPARRGRRCGGRRACSRCACRRGAASRGGRCAGAGADARRPIALRPRSSARSHTAPRRARGRRGCARGWGRRGP